MFDLIAAKLFADTYVSIIDYFSDGQRIYISDDNFRYYLEKINSINPVFRPETVCQSYEYIPYLVRRAAAISRLRNQDPRQRFLNIFNEIMKQKDVDIREKMLVNFILGGGGFQKSENPEFVYSEALKHISNPDHRRVIEELRLSRRKGSPAYNFTLTDVDGNNVRLSDFKNKVVVVDCWLTGCIPCANLAKLMGKEVVPQFKDRKDLVFLSVNVNKNKDMWFKTLQWEEYSYPGFINLYTQGLGVNHPFVLKYNFRGFPQLLLIDRSGNILSPNIRGSAAEIVSSIREALNSK